MAGPLTGVRVVELAGIGPGPFCAMLLSDLGAEVVRVERADQVGPERPATFDAMGRGRRSIAVDLKNPRGTELVLELVKRADALIEGFRPGVTERLGVGPDACHAVNPSLVYGRMTGWGQDGPLAPRAGHDINYISLTGSLAAIGKPGVGPTVPLNLIGDFGGGAMFLAVGVLAAVLHARETGDGQVVDAAMTDGSALLMTLMHGMLGGGGWRTERAANLLDGGAPFYDTYETADGGWMAVGCLEPQFYAAMLGVLGRDELVAGEQMDAAKWPRMREILTETFRSRTRKEWAAAFDGIDACVSPVLDMLEAPGHPHNAARGTYIDVGGLVQPAPAPRFSRSLPQTPSAPAQPGEHTLAVLADWGFDSDMVEGLIADGAIRQR